MRPACILWLYEICSLLTEITKMFWNVFLSCGTLNVDVQFGKFKNIYLQIWLLLRANRLLYVWRQRPGLLKTESQLGSQIVTVLFNTFHAFMVLTFFNLVEWPLRLQFFSFLFWNRLRLQVVFHWVGSRNTFLHHMQQSIFWLLGEIRHSSQIYVLVIMFS